MKQGSKLKVLLAAGASVLALSGPTLAADFDIPSGNLKAALDAYARQTGTELVYPEDAIKNANTRGIKGSMPDKDALVRILSGTGFIAQHEGSAIAILPAQSLNSVAPLQLAQAVPPPRAAVETVTVTSSKLGGADVQSIPIAITALSQEQLTSSQTAGGPDLVKQVPNLTFTKTNFTGYSIQIRGIGTQAISVTTDPAVSVALNDIPFIRNHFFEQEFYDLSQAEVLRGPQGTLYGRNATAGVVNLVTAKPTDQFEAMASGDIGNYRNRRFEGMINIPILDDRLDLRIAGEWTKRSGYTTNTVTGNQVDGRDLWSGRMSLGWKPTPNLKATLVWEHFSEDDDRMRTAKQLCKTDPGLSSVDGVPVPDPSKIGSGLGIVFTVSRGYLSQGCLPASLYAPESFGVPYSYSLPIVVAGYFSGIMNPSKDPYASTIQSTNLRDIETQIDPIYRAKNDTIELNADYNVTSSLTFSSQTGYNQDFLYSTEDYNRFNTSPGIFQQITSGDARHQSLVDASGVFCDPQLGCSTRLVAQDISSEHAWQLSQEFRLASSFSGPFNFSVGGNYMHYETLEDYYVLSNALTAFAATSGSQAQPGGLPPWEPGVSDNHECLLPYGQPGNGSTGQGYQYPDPNGGAGTPQFVCYYIDPNPLSSLNGEGHEYFRSQNPYVLNSYALFGESYYNIFNDLKLTAGVRWTDDRKHFTDIPSELLVIGIGYLSTGQVDQTWDKVTGRFAINWTPKLDFTDQTLFYSSYAHGYKAGGANPPGAHLVDYSSLSLQGIPLHPLTFAPEYIDAFELGTKNTLLDGSLTLNGSAFFYNYTGYQISEIVDRTAINTNYNATVKGAELEATYEPMPGLKFKFAGGYENTRIDNGQQAVDLMDRTAGHPGWVVMKPFVTTASNCIFPDYVVEALMTGPGLAPGNQGNFAVSACGIAYTGHLDPVPNQLGGPTPFDPSTDVLLSDGTHYHGFDPISPTATNSGYGPAPNNGEGFAKDLGGNELPNAPPFTVSASVDYTIPLSSEWAGTAHVDYYWQDYSWTRVFNDNPYDRLRGYTNVNLALILTSQGGWQMMGYVKNIFNVTDITGAFLNSDDSGLTTNVFITDPRLFGVRVTKNW